MTKICTKCRVEKPATREFFAVHPLGKCGLQPRCKLCRNLASSKKEQSSEQWEKFLESQRARRGATYVEYLRDYYRRNKAILSAKQKQYVVKNREEIARYQKQWRAENRERLLIEKQRWNRANKDRLRPKKRVIAQDRWRSDIRYRLSKIISCSIRQSIRGGKSGRPWEDCVGYDVYALMVHLEKRFEPGMTWDNYGFRGWHIDHKRPVASFQFAKVEDPEFKQCWDLNNLQPLWGIENLKKGASYEP